MSVQKLRQDTPAYVQRLAVCTHSLHAVPGTSVDLAAAYDRYLAFKLDEILQHFSHEIYEGNLSRQVACTT